MLEEIKDHDMIEKEATNDDRVAEVANRLMDEKEIDTIACSL